MTFGLLVPRGRRLLTPGATYVLGIAVLTLSAIALAQAGVDPGSLLVVVAAALGPLGVLAGFVLVLLTTFGEVGVDLSLRAEAGPAFDLALLAVVLAVAASNVLVVARSTTLSDGPLALRRSHIRVPVVTDRLIGGAAFVTAGALFIGLCIIAGLAALLADGVDVVEPPLQAGVTRLATGLAWIPAVVAAFRGRALWRSSILQGRPILRTALIDLVIQTAALAGLLLFLTTSHLASGGW